MSNEQTIRKYLEIAGAAITAAEECYNCMRDLLRNLDAAFEALCGGLKEVREPLEFQPSPVTPEECAQKLEQLRAAGAPIPQEAIDFARNPSYGISPPASLPVEGNVILIPTGLPDYQAGYQQALRDLAPKHPFYPTSHYLRPRD